MPVDVDRRCLYHRGRADASAAFPERSRTGRVKCPSEDGLQPPWISHGEPTRLPKPHSILRQPVQRFLASFENRKFAPGKFLQVLTKHLGEALRRSTLPS